MLLSTIDLNGDPDIAAFRLSPDEKRLAMSLVDPKTSLPDIWMSDLVRGSLGRFTFGPQLNAMPQWSPDGMRLAYRANTQGLTQIYGKSAGSGGTEAAILGEALARKSGVAASNMNPTDWSRDGRFILYSAFDPPTGWDVWMLPLAGGQPFPFAATPAEERNAKMSPDGRFVAYTLVQGERSDVYVQPYPATGAKWQVSREGGQHPAWSGDGRTLFFASADKKVMAVDVVTRGAELTIGQPRVAVDTRIEGRERTNQGSPFAVTPNGDRFIVSTAAEAAVPITVVLNWQGLFEK
jgi:Tol biopolymer transport system component